MAKIKIQAPTKINSVVNGLQFRDGVAVLDTLNTSHQTGGGSLQDILERFEAMGFKVASGQDAGKSEKPSSDKGGAG